MVDKRELEQGLITSLVQWDNKTTSELELLYPGFVSLNNFTLVLLHLLSDPQTEIGASWLIKHHLDNHQRISAAEIELFFEKYHDLTCWQSRLHWLQSLSYFKVPAKFKTPVEYLLRYAISDDNTFVRAWAYNGLVHLAKSYPELKEEVVALCELAMEDEAASIKARIRNAIKDL